MRFRSIIWIALLLAQASMAQVNRNSGLFYVNYSDMDFPESGWSVERTYSSFSVDRGSFGMGWSTNLSNRLWPLPDGQLLVIPFGSGQGDLYLPGRMKEPGMYRMIDSIVTDEVRRNKLAGSPKDLIRRRSELVMDPSERANAYVRFLRRSSLGCVPDTPIHANRWVNEDRESEIIDWKEGLYQLTQYNRHFQFDACGRMVSWKDPKGRRRFVYDGDQLRYLIVNDRDTAWVQASDNGLIRSIRRRDSLGRWEESCYVYDSAGYLLQSIDAGGNLYRFEYDRNFNLVGTRYTSGQYRRMEYDPATGRIVAFRERNGDSTRYEYGYMFLPDGHVNEDHYYTRTRFYDSARTRVFNTYFETEYRIASNGERYRYQMIERSDTSLVINQYPAHVGNVIYRRVNDREAWSDYDGKMRPLYLRMKDSVYTTRYNAAGLPERFQAIDSVRRDTVTYVYTYDAAGTLSTVVRRGVLYRVRGSVEAGEVSLTQGGRTWTIGFLKGQPVYIIDPVEGKQAVEALEKKASKTLEKMLHELLYLVQPLKIEHEWVWERMGS